MLWGKGTLGLDFCKNALILLVGAAGVGKSTFAKAHFQPSEILSSDHFRELISGDAGDQSASADAFALLYHLLDMRMKRGLLSVIDATNLQANARGKLETMAKSYNIPVYAVILDRPLETLFRQNAMRERQVPQSVISEHFQQIQSLLHDDTWRKGFKNCYYLDESLLDRPISILRRDFAGDYGHIAGRFDCIGDVHGCFDELLGLIAQLGYHLEKIAGRWVLSHPDDRRLLFVGDLVDRGPKSPEVMELVMDLYEDGQALSVIGNHDDKLMRYLQGRNVSLTHGLEETVDQLTSWSSAFKERLKTFLEGLPTHISLDKGRLILAHAAYSTDYHGQDNKKTRGYFLYGPVSGKVSASGLPDRIDWAPDYKGDALILYGHSPVRIARIVGNTVNLDTGCVYGGALTAYRYPEKDCLTFQSKKRYATMRRGYYFEGE